MEAEKWFDASGFFIGAIPPECVADCTQQGQDAAITVCWWRLMLGFEAPRSQAIEYLVATGGWLRGELERQSKGAIDEKVLWLACCDIREQGEYLGLVN